MVEKSTIPNEKVKPWIFIDNREEFILYIEYLEEIKKKGVKDTPEREDRFIRRTLKDYGSKDFGKCSLEKYKRAISN